MKTVQSPHRLLQNHDDLITSIRTQADIVTSHWDALHAPLLSRTAEHLQELPNRTGDQQLLAMALRAALVSLQRTADAKFEQFPHRKRYACFAAALTYDCADPAADLEVNVIAADGKNTVWEPLEGSTIADIGNAYTAFWTHRRLDAATVRPAVTWSMLPLTARRWLSAEREIVHEYMAVTARPNAQYARYIPQLDRQPHNPSPQLHEFIDYLHRLIKSGKYNRPTSRLHVVAKGLLLVLPGIFSDFNTLAADEIAIRLRGSPLLVPCNSGGAKTNTWRFRSENGQQLKGWIIDPDRAGITAPDDLSQHLHPLKIA